jgi:hypothetical protein
MASAFDVVESSGGSFALVIALTAGQHHYRLDSGISYCIAH